MIGTRWWQTRTFVILALIATALPLLYPPVPPLADLPAHMGRYRVMLGTDAATLSQWYRFGWKPIGYLGVDLLVAALAPLVGLEPAVKAIVVAIPVLTAGGILWLSNEAHGRIQPLAVLALPLAYNLAFQMGFLNYTLSMALVLNAFALWLRWGRLGRFRLRVAVFVPLSCAIWTAHLFGWLVLGVCAGAAELVRARGEHRGWPSAVAVAIVRCLPLALPSAMFLLWRPDGPQAGNDWLDVLRYKPGWLVMSLIDRWKVFDLATIGIIVMLLYRSARSPRTGRAQAVTLAAVLLGAAFILMPFGAAYADARLAPYIVILALLAVRSAPREARVLAAIGLAMFVVRTAAGTVSMAVESRAWSRHLEAVDHIPRGARVAVFAHATCEQPWRRSRTGHLAGMATVRRGAFANDQFDLHSTALLTVIAPGVDGYALDPSQVVVDRTCPASPEFRTLDAALRGLPRGGFDHVWLIEPTRVDPALLRGMTQRWSNGTDYLFRIDRPRL